MTTSTPVKVAEAATTQNALPASGSILLGVFGPEANLQALVRFSSGRTKRMSVGGRISGNRIVAIDRNGVILEKGNETQHLAIVGY